MSFWNSVKRKARKEHTCKYCGKKIKKGEEYSRETGIYEGDFNDYCLCLRCRFLVDEFEHDDYLHEFADTLIDNDLMLCPACGTSNLSEWEFTDDMQSCECECDNCGEKWVADLSIEGIKRIITSTR
ncbi:hypothetical protein CIW83_18275 [Tissierella sp. P1]|uniref:hypothetical protein n=1 Tax=Tissierella sp. P1 TaxID=1280483 RepID=UPI000BA1354E|nr:hypothetical protein [Tissierella sp. P1]OZV10766.1 hypothetical protein CIW83_18275 [Tissierella sp. P1]